MIKIKSERTIQRRLLQQISPPRLLIVYIYTNKKVMNNTGYVLKIARRGEKVESIYYIK